MVVVVVVVVVVGGGGGAAAAAAAAAAAGRGGGGIWQFWGGGCVGGSAGIDIGVLFFAFIASFSRRSMESIRIPWNPYV